MDPLQSAIAGVLLGSGVTTAAFGIYALDLRRRQRQLKAAMEELNQTLSQAVERHTRQINSHELASIRHEEAVRGLESRTAGLAENLVALGREVKGELTLANGRLDELTGQLEAFSGQQQAMLSALDRQLQEMQAFIVRAADQAKSQRQNLPSPPVMAQTPAVAQATAPQAPVSQAPADELQQLVARQQAAMAAFTARRAAAAAAQTPGIERAGL